MGVGAVSLASRGECATGGRGIACDSPLGGHMFERAHASEFVSASVRRVFAEGTGANAPAQTVDPPPHPPPRPTLHHITAPTPTAPADAQPNHRPHTHHPGRRASMSSKLLHGLSEPLTQLRVLSVQPV